MENGMNGKWNKWKMEPETHQSLLKPFRMNVVKEIERINTAEAELGMVGTSSWHDRYRDSAYLFVGGLDYGMSEGDVICVFSQYGEIVDCYMGREKDTGKSKGFCFLAYEDQRSTVLAVDNLNGIKLCGRTIRVDHVAKYRPPKEDEEEEEEEEEEKKTKKRKQEEEQPKDRRGEEEEERWPHDRYKALRHDDPARHRRDSRPSKDRPRHRRSRSRSRSRSPPRRRDDRR